MAADDISDAEDEMVGRLKVRNSMRLEALSDGIFAVAMTLLVKDPYVRVSIGAYGLNLIAIGVLLFLIWKHAADGYRLVDRNLPARVIRFAYLRCLLGPACYFVAILLSLIDPLVSLVIFMLIPLVYILPGLEQYWLKLAGR